MERHRKVEKNRKERRKDGPYDTDRVQNGESSVTWKVTEQRLRRVKIRNRGEPATRRKPEKGHTQIRSTEPTPRERAGKQDRGVRPDRYRTRNDEHEKIANQQPPWMREMNKNSPSTINADRETEETNSCTTTELSPNVERWITEMERKMDMYRVEMCALEKQREEDRKERRRSSENRRKLHIKNYYIKYRLGIVLPRLWLEKEATRRHRLKIEI